MYSENGLITLFGGCLRVLGFKKWRDIFSLYSQAVDSQDFPGFLTEKITALELPPFIGELAQLEEAYSHVRFGNEVIFAPVDTLTVNPTLLLLHLNWQNLVPLLQSEKFVNYPEPLNNEELVLIWQNPTSLLIRMKVASRQELLALKVVGEEIDRKKTAAAADSDVGEIDLAVENAVNSGIILAPAAKLRRPGSHFSSLKDIKENNLTAKVFTLQWHITQVCDLHCRHCYDRSKRSPLHLHQGYQILDQLRDFSLSRNVRAQVTFTGGNPFLYPHFFELYKGAVEKGFTVAVLGNPTPRNQLQQLIKIRKPNFFQVSLEGLPAHNDSIRGKGHFRRIIKFLSLLRELEVSSMIMLTLTSENIDQVIPLAEFLRDKVDDFFFNRLSLVGEGASLKLPSPDKYQQFLSDYLKAAKDNPVMGLKDSLINIIRHREGRKLFGGCCGFGCGAAFNFFSVLPDGEVHACRKFPSSIGNIFTRTLAQIYDSSSAEKYRQGCSECNECSLKPLCGGCLAISYSHGQDIFKQRDPFCFIG